MEKIKLTPKEKKIKLEKELGNNPFTFSININIPTAKRPTGRYYEDSEGFKLPEESIQDIEPYTKVFIGRGNRDVINKLNDRCKSMLLWIMQELEAGRDYVYLPRKRYMEELDISSTTTVTNAFAELTRCSFITPSVIKDIYWINPMFIFRGDRIKKYCSKFSFKNVKEQPQWNK